MIRYFSSYIFGAVLSVSSINSYAGENPVSIVVNKETTACTARYGDNDSECLSSLSKLTEKRLNTVYQDKLKEISDYDYTQWWMGDKRRREEMKKAFIRSQELWLKYRQDYCKAASAGAEGIDGYGAIALSCDINMGIRRIDEIRMVHPDLSEG
ncbi:lysozyme inhibitor LprI family protein [Rosenbergiella australiborealis]|uniref:lysozyme inhibitor LprI family protein n=1 Tax=Rosenbergiella australiborealis TaxID=1544696 RepID=UPI001F4E6AB4|nr:lysozyme inhibitor LprI family protein [Rosenbergiella australiborealis]